MRKLLLAGAMLALLPITAQAANFYQWPGIWFQANPPDTYSTVLILTSGAHCPGRAGPGTPVSVGFDGNQGERVYSCLNYQLSQTWDYHPRFKPADVGAHTITVTVGDKASTHNFAVPSVDPAVVPEAPSAILLPLVAIAVGGLVLVWKSRLRPQRLGLR